jgi:penicillin-binding protein 2
VRPADEAIPGLIAPVTLPTFLEDGSILPPVKEKQ